ncbi:Transposase and inactivated derivatives, TnpA family [Peptoclostridium litorale DSM 5388]|uniref:Tn3 family transposase n=1 Tax=Peptoclostridium litorale TaxID=1557 RepID=UPI00056DF1F2|nr:Tn3 family transposase [Peptoclostridium litorale]SIO36560.1 Transposase and inactivated derivatives, TnpA family [Peptoclostridium litorale DSM 5388]
MSEIELLLTKDQRHELIRISEEISEWDLARHYTLSGDDIDFALSHRRDSNKLGCAVQLCMLRYPGWPLIDKNMIPFKVIHFIADQFGIEPEEFQNYAIRDNTRLEHLQEIRSVYNYTSFNDVTDSHKIINNLMPFAIENDNAIRLLKIAIDKLRSDKIILPGITTLERIVIEARTAAENTVMKSINNSLTDSQKENLDKLIHAKDEKRTPLAWLKEPTGFPSAKTFQEVIQKLEYIRSLDLELNISAIHPNRIRQLARLGSKYEPHSFRRFDSEKRHAMLAVYLHELSHQLVDTAIEIHDRQINILLSKGRKELEKKQKNNGKSLNEKVVHFRDLGKALIQAREQGVDPFEAIEEVMSWDQFIKSVEESKELARPIGYDYLDLIDKRYNQLRKYTPILLKHFKFSANNKSFSSLIEALEIINETNESGKRKIPENVPIDFISKRWSKYVFKKDGIDRHYYEMAALTELKNRIRSGDIAVSGSKNFKEFKEYLLTDNEWSQRKNVESKLAVDLNVNSYLEERIATLTHRTKWLNRNLNSLSGLEIKNGRIYIEKLEKQTPDAARHLSQHLYKMLPRIKLTDLFIEVDQWTGFIRHFTHASTKKSARTDEKNIVVAALMAMGMNIGFSKMADSTPGISYRQIANVAQWRMYDDAMQRAQASLVNSHHRLFLSSYWGDGSTSSSDGMRVQVGVSSMNAEHNPHYGSNRGTTMYRFVSDQFSSYYTKLINTNVRDAVHVIDGLLYHETDLDIKEHYTDTAGYTDQVFGLAHLLGFRFAPRIRDISELKFYTFGKPSDYTKLEKILTGKINTKVIQENYDDVLKLAYSILEGKVSGSLIMSKLGSYARQNSLATALREMGRIEKTIFLFDYISNEALRRRIQKGLNKGEAVNALARAIFFGKRGELRERELYDQLQRASALNIIINAISIWNTVYLQKAIEYTQQHGGLDESLIKHIAPLGWEHINFLGEYRFDSATVPEYDELRPLNIESKAINIIESSS